MALILKQEANANVTTPPAGSGAVFLNTSDQLTVKDTAGNVSTIPTFTSTGNTAVFFNDGGALGESANLSFVKTTNTLTVTNGNLVAGGVKTDNLYYANGQPWDLSDPGGSNTQIQFNDQESFGGSANFVWNNSSNTLTVTGTSNVTGTLNVTGNAGFGNVNAGNALTANFVAGTLTTSAQPNITSVGTLTTLETSGNAVIGGNLTVNGNITYINVETFDVEDPIISVGGGPNGAPLTTNDGKDRGMLMHYYTVGGAVDAFMGWDNSNSEFAFGSNVTTVNDVETFNTYGNVRASTYIGNYFTGVLTYAAQPNITSVGTLQSLFVGATSSSGDFANAKAISSQDNSGGTAPDNIGLVAEAVASSANTAITGIGLLGVARANSSTKGTGVQGEAKVTNTADTGAAVGVRGYATDTHAGGYNIGVLGNAIGSGVGNYAFYIQNGGIGSIENATFWDLTDNSAAALTFNSTGKANIFGIETTDNSEGIFTSGYLNVTGNITAVAGIKTDNYYYANGSPVDFQQAGGSNTQVQFNDANGFGGSAAFTFDKSTNAVSMGGTLTVTGNASAGNISTGGLISATGNVSGGNLTTAGAVVATGNVSGGNLTTAGALSVTGNATAGNISTGGVINATGNISGGNISGTLLTGTLTTAAQPNITSVGTLTSLTVTGNASAGNLNTAGKVVASTLESNVATGTAPFVVTSTTQVANLNVATAGTAGTVTTAAQPNITSVGTLTSLGVNGTVTAAAFTANTGVFTGNGSGLSAIAGGNVTGQVGNALVAGTVYTAAQPNITSVGTLTSVAVTGNATAGNVYANSGTIGASLLTGTLTTAAQPNVTSVGTLSSLSVTGNVAAGNLTTTGVLSVTGTGVSSIAGNLDMTSNNIINLAEPVNSTDAATKAYVDSIAQGLHTHDSCNAATNTTLASISGGTVTYNNGTSGVGATLTTTGSYTTIDGVTLSNGMRILVKNEANAAHNGIYDRTSSTVLTRSTDFDTPTEMAGGDFTFVTAGTLYDNTGWVMTDPVTTVGTTDVNWAQFSGAGTYTAGTGLTLTGSQFSVNVAQPTITSLGTLTGLGVNGTITAVDITANTGVFTGNGSGLTALNASNISSGTLAQARLANASLTVNGQSITLGGSGTITANTTQTLTLGTYLTGTSFNGGTAVTAAVDATSANTASKVVARDASGNFSAGTITATLSGAATTAGTVTTAAQPNITSVGTLSSLSVTGNISAGNVSATAGTFTSVSGDGSALTSLNASNISSGTLAQARLANASVTLGSTALTLGSTVTTVAGLSSVTSTSFVGALTGAATTAGTVTTAAQPNITSVGTLTSLSVSGALTTTNITTGANTTAGTITGNFSLSAGSRLNATYADLAERYVADAAYEPGTVLVFGGSKEVTVTGEVSSRKVAGVVSTNPAYLMNSECQGEYVVDLALIGRVPCKVMGPVCKGDLIVTSENTGYGMVNNEAPAGSIIGKSLEFMNELDGVVEILVGRC
jgi:hypothetical protein